MRREIKMSSGFIRKKVLAPKIMCVVVRPLIQIYVTLFSPNWRKTRPTYRGFERSIVTVRFRSEGVGFHKRLMLLIRMLNLSMAVGCLPLKLSRLVLVVAVRANSSLLDSDDVGVRVNEPRRPSRLRAASTVW